MPIWWPLHLAGHAKLSKLQLWWPRPRTLCLHVRQACLLIFAPLRISLRTKRATCAIIENRLLKTLLTSRFSPVASPGFTPSSTQSTTSTIHYQKFNLILKLLKPPKTHNGYLNRLPILSQQHTTASCLTK